MLEQEIASAIKFILKNTENPAPYYYSVPQDFMVPAAYFPSPEVVSGGDTLTTYALDYSWFIKFFHKDTESAYELAHKALTTIKRMRCTIPLIDEAGESTGRSFRLSDPTLKPLDHAAQLTIRWASRRPYYAVEAQKTKSFEINLHTKRAYTGAVSQISEMED